jgi:3-hydroxybutyryl-CoA dehydratase
MKAPLFSLDFDELGVGTQFETRGRTITESDVVWFAALTGDRHPIHTDASWAREATYSERVAHGMLVLSYALGLVPLDPDRVLGLAAVESTVFKAPARIGETIRLRGSLERLRALDHEVGTVRLAGSVRGDGDRRLAQIAAQLLWRRGGCRTDRAEPSGDAIGVLVAADDCIIPY